VHDALALLDGGARRSSRAARLRAPSARRTGYAPALDRCARAARAATGRAIYLALERGGSSAARASVPNEPVRPIAAATARELARLAASPLAEAGTDATPRRWRGGASCARRCRRGHAGPLHAREFLAARSR
jgi:hypothetical protein